MNRSYSLSFLTCLGAGPEEAIDAAARAGYDNVGLRLLPAAPGGIAFPLMDQPARVKDLVQRMKDCGIGLFDVEMIRVGPDFDPALYLPFLDCAARLGAKAILVAGDDPDEGRLANSYAKLCEAGAGFNLWLDLEFMPQSQLRDLAAALRVLGLANQPNQGLLVDALHVSRSHTSNTEIAAIPIDYLHYAQICDGPSEIPTTLEALNYAARHERLMPGDGAIDLAGLFEALPATLPIAVEVPNDKQSAGLSAYEWAKHALEKTKHCLEGNRDHSGS
jgi:sugar phosphate isomerase/epimerase